MNNDVAATSKYKENIFLGISVPKISALVSPWNLSFVLVSGSFIAHVSLALSPRYQLSHNLTHLRKFHDTCSTISKFHNITFPSTFSNLLLTWCFILIIISLFKALTIHVTLFVVDVGLTWKKYLKWGAWSERERDWVDKESWHFWTEFFDYIAMHSLCHLILHLQWYPLSSTYHLYWWLKGQHDLWMWRKSRSQVDCRRFLLLQSIKSSANESTEAAPSILLK